MSPGDSGASEPAATVMGETDREVGALASGGYSTPKLHEAVLAELEREGASGAVLDFGAGRGVLAAALAERPTFSRVVAADLVRYNVSPARVEWIYCDLNGPLPAPDASFDAVVAVGVVEYLENPFAVAREWLRLLRPDGVLVATTPNNESWRSLLSLLVRGHFAAFASPLGSAPITALLRADIRRVLSAAGFTEPRFFFPSYGALPKLTSLSWQRISARRLRGVRYSDDFGIVARKRHPEGS